MRRLLTISICFWLVAISLGFAEQAPSRSMKGWELYSWQAEQNWYFALLPGTNRLKTDGEVTSNAVKGVEAVKDSLKKLRKGEYVFWRGLSTAPFATDDIRKEIETYCKQLGLELHVYKNPLQEK